MSFFKKLTALVMLFLTGAAAVFSCYLILPKKVTLTKYEPTVSVINNIEKALNSSSNKTSSANKSTSSDTVLTAAKAEVMGAIKTEVISPYKAPISYNKVYMKNQAGVNIDIKKELKTPLSIKIKKSKEPEVLIFSTHTTESYMLEDRNYYTKSDATGTTDSTKNVVKIGSIIKSKLEAAGISVVQADTIHDHPKFSGCYDRSAETVKSYLKKYPSIKVVIDVHRDSVNYDDGTKVKPTVKINGKKAAQVMLVAGCETGSVENFPNWKENLRLAMKLHQCIEVMYPSLARPITFTARRYNLHLTNGSMLIEIGTEANTLEEASFSAELVGNALVSLLNMQK